MGLGRKITTGLAATAVAIGGLGIGASAANAVPYAPGKGAQERVIGKPGCISKEKLRPSYINKNGVLIFETMCTYRTKSGQVIKNYRTGSWAAQWSTAGKIFGA